MKLKNLDAPLAITMWDFSWLERRYPGAGYEDWDLALDELVERGYNAVRIDAYPHLIAEDAEREWTLKPAWNQNAWGAPTRCKLQIQPSLNEFIGKCAARGVMVGLSSWYQRVEEFELINILSPKRHAEIWKSTLDSVAAAGLMESVLYVDLCNEWPFKNWAPYYKPDQDSPGHWCDADSLAWMRSSIDYLKVDYPDMPMTYSYVGRLRYEQEQISAIRGGNDFLEPHIWMVQANGDEFYNRMGGYYYHKWEPTSYEQVQKYAEKLYRTDPEHWKKLLEGHIDISVNQSLEIDLPLITTECWGIVDYKDWPMLDWEWVKEICAHGVRYASSQGRWLANATSNFCGPQFVGMWRDIEWHREMTDTIKLAKLPE